MKRTILAAACLAMGVSSIATAGMYTPCTSQPVTIPCAKSGWHLLAEGLYLQPTNDDLEYFETSTDVLPLSRQAVRPEHRFGFRLEGGYHFDSGNDLTLSWMHFDKSFNDHFSSPGASDGDFDLVDANAKFDIDLVNLEFGQHFDIGTNGDLRLHFGGQYAKLDTHLMYAHFQVEDSEVSDPLLHSKHLSEFHGIGPRAGVDWYYHLSHGFDVVSRAAGSVLIGEHKNEWRRTVQPVELAWGPFVAPHKRKTLIPTAEGRAGLRYTHNGQGVKVMIEGGWHVMGIFQSIHHVSNDSVTGTALRPQQNVSNYGHHGAYLNISVAG